MKQTRRDFLKASSTVLSGVAASNLSICRSAHARGIDTIKVGMIGCGGRGARATVQITRRSPLSNLSNGFFDAAGDLHRIESPRP